MDELRVPLPLSTMTTFGTNGAIWCRSWNDTRSSMTFFFFAWYRLKRWWGNSVTSPIYIVYKFDYPSSLNIIPQTRRRKWKTSVFCTLATAALTPALAIATTLKDLSPLSWLPSFLCLGGCKQDRCLWPIRSREIICLLVRSFACGILLDSQSSSRLVLHRALHKDTWRLCLVSRIVHDLSMSRNKTKSHGPLQTGSGRSCLCRNLYWGLQKIPCVPYMASSQSLSIYSPSQTMSKSFFKSRAHWEDKQQAGSVTGRQQKKLTASKKNSHESGYTCVRGIFHTGPYYIS